MPDQSGRTPSGEALDVDGYYADAVKREEERQQDMAGRTTTRHMCGRCGYWTTESKCPTCGEVYTGSGRGTTQESAGHMGQERMPRPDEVGRTRTRPRRGDLEAATAPHPFQPSGEYVGYGQTKERCDLCGLVQQGEDTHHDVEAP